MSDLDYQSERDPLFWWRGHPVRMAQFLVVVHSAFLLLFMVLFASGESSAGGDASLADKFVRTMVFHTGDFFRGHFWTPLTYGFVHLPQGVLRFAIGMYMLWVFGGQVEQYLGKRLFSRLYAVLWLIAPLVLLCFSGLGAQMIMGASLVNLGVFVAFAALYPSATVFFTIPAKWIAALFVAINAVEAIAGRDLPTLALLAATTFAAWLFVAVEKGQIAFRLPRLFARKPKLRVLPRPAGAMPSPVRRKPNLVVVSNPHPQDDVDTLLDKIARSGIASLTAEERARLERASAELNKGR